MSGPDRLVRRRRPRAGADIRKARQALAVDDARVVELTLLAATTVMLNRYATALALPTSPDVRDLAGLHRDPRSALGREELTLAYQPIVGTRDGAVVGVEALLRWTHAEHDAVPAPTAVDATERSDQIGGLGTWVLERSCTEHGLWLVEHPRRLLDLSVNVSAPQLMSPGSSATVSSILRATDMDPRTPVLEVTEGHFIQDGTRATGALAELRALGVRLALDDFGAGYCSLGYLRRLPVDILKIAPGLVAHIGKHPSEVAIVHAVSAPAHVLGLRVTAEGVETEQQHQGIMDIGCDHAQEYLYSGPMPASAMPALLRDGLDGRGNPSLSGG